MFNRKPGFTAQQFNYLTGLHPNYYGLVYPGGTWRARLRRWVARRLWRLTRWTGRKGWARRRVLAPWTIAAAAWIVAAAAHFVSHGWSTVLTLGALGALPTYRWLGLPAGRLTRRRGLKPVEQRAWYAAAYAALVALATVTAGWRVGAPMPGFWLAATLTVWVRWLWHHRTRQAAPVPVEHLGERLEKWQRIAGPGKPLAGAELFNITDLDAPRRWVADVDLPSGDLTVADVMSKHRKLASLWSTRRDNVIVDEALDGAEDAARLTVVVDNPCHSAIEYDETWQDFRDGCIPFHTYPDGTRGRLRLWLPRSGTVHSFFSGDTRSGKTAGMEAALTQAVMTGMVWPMVGDPQGGQSLPAWCREDGSGAARSQSTHAEGVYNQLLRLRAAMYARSGRLQRMTWTDEDGDRIRGMGFFDPVLTGWPTILYLLDEAHIAVKDPEYGKLILTLIEEIVKMGGKTGIFLWLANQYPGIEELGNKMAIRQNLMAGNVVSYRNSAGHVAKSMLLPPHMPSPYGILPETPTGDHTKGTAVIYSAAPRSSRASHSRTVWVRKAQRWADTAQRVIPELDPDTAEALAPVTAGAARTSEPVSEQVPQQREVITVRTAPETQLDLCVAYLRTVDRGFAHTGPIADGARITEGAASQALARGVKKGRIRKVRRGVWGLGPAELRQPAEDLAAAGAA